MQGVFPFEKASHGASSRTQTHPNSLEPNPNPNPNWTHPNSLEPTGAVWDTQGAPTYQRLATVVEGRVSEWLPSYGRQVIRLNGTSGCAVKQGYVSEAPTTIHLPIVNAPITPTEPQPRSSKARI